MPGFSDLCVIPNNNQQLGVFVKRNTKEFIQHLGHEFDDDEDGRAKQLLEDSLPLIGLVVMYFNRLEKFVDSTICEAISDSLGLLVIHGIPYTAKVDLYKRICDDFHCCIKGAVLSYEGLIEKLKEVGRLRNLVVHADWENTDSEGYTYVRLQLTDRGMRQEYVHLTAESMEKILGQVQSVAEQLDKYLSDRSKILIHG